MRVRVVPAAVDQVSCDALIVNLFEGVTEPGGATGAVDAALGGALAEWLRATGFRGRLCDTAVLPTWGRIPARAVVIVGLGPRPALDRLRLTRVAAAAVRAAREAGARTVATIAHGAGVGGFDAATAARAVVEGSLYGAYRFDRYRQEAERRDVEELLLVERDPAKAAVMEAAVETGLAVAEAVRVARDLANEPPNVLGPAELAARARELAAEAGLECEVLEASELERLGARALLGVGQGSARPPVLLVLRHRGRGGRQGYDLALVGKGITFDSGGLSLKTADGMVDMKFDMAGGAAVLGAMRAIARLRLPLDVLGLVPAAENMPGGRAQRPGDVVRTLAGKTVEIVNTDAEGRLILADAVAYARREGAARIVDVATLTGAAAVALGSVASALVANDDTLAGLVERAAAAAGERVWRLPSWEEYRELYRSELADMRNSALRREAGAIVGALVIGESAGETPWAHLDIAATAWGDRKPYRDPGATGAAAPTLIQLALELAGR